MKCLCFLILFLPLLACHRKFVLVPDTKKLSENALKGQEIFMHTCNRCHPDGMAGLGPSIVNKHLPSFLIKFQVRNGLGAMPSFSKDHLPKEELNEVVKYIKERSD